MALRADSRPIYTVCQGCPASGKSTWSRSQPQLVVRVNRDDVRRELFNFGQWCEYKFTKTKEDQVSDVINGRIRAAFTHGYSVIDDNTNLNPIYLAKTAAFARDLGFNVEFKQFFDVPLHKLIERNISREFSVPEGVIHEMFAKQLHIQGRIITPVDGLPECIIVDVDGTVADMGKGQPWGRGAYEWLKVGQDRPKKNVLNFVRSLWNTGEKIIFLTGRDGVCLEETKKWLSSQLDPYYSKLFHNAHDLSAEIFIRTPDDMRPDCDIKEELLRKHILPRYNVRFCLDDRAQICHHYRALGLEVWQVANGFF